jgi:hypothetical protein
LYHTDNKDIAHVSSHMGYAERARPQLTVTGPRRPPTTVAPPIPVQPVQLSTARHSTSLPATPTVVTDDTLLDDTVSMAGSVDLPSTSDYLQSLGVSALPSGPTRTTKVRLSCRKYRLYFSRSLCPPPLSYERI